LRKLRLVGMIVPVVLLAAGVLAPVRAGAQDWQKTYLIAGKASLTLNTGDVPIDLHGCAECHAVKIDVDWKDRKPTDFILKEPQGGDQVSFELKEKAQFGIHISVRNWHAPHVTVETPAELNLEAKTSDGAVKVTGVQGDVHLHTSDGAVDVSDVSGNLHLGAGDGAITIHNAPG